MLRPVIVSRPLFTLLESHIAISMPTYERAGEGAFPGGSVYRRLHAWVVAHPDDRGRRIARLLRTIMSSNGWRYLPQDQQVAAATALGCLVNP